MYCYISNSYLIKPLLKGIVISSLNGLSTTLSTYVGIISDNYHDYRFTCTISWKCSSYLFHYMAFEQKVEGCCSEFINDNTILPISLISILRYMHSIFQHLLKVCTYKVIPGLLIETNTFCIT